MRATASRFLCYGYKTHGGTKEEHSVTHQDNIMQRAFGKVGILRKVTESEIVLEREETTCIKQHLSNPGDTQNMT